MLIAAFALTFLGWALYIPVSRSMALRRTMWPLWMLHGLGTATALASPLFITSTLTVTQWVTLAGTSGSVLAWLAVYRWMLHVPRHSGRPAPGHPLPAFELMDEHERPFRPADYINKGPLLLVFFRGYW